MEPYPTPNLMEQDLMDRLKAVSFVDKIVFGKLNYNAKVSQFEDSKEFYNELASSVMRFCKKNRISCHIKEGTKING